MSKQKEFKKLNISNLRVCCRKKAVVPFRVFSLTLERKSSNRGRHELTTRLVGTTQITGEALGFLQVKQENIREIWGIGKVPRLS